MVFLYTERYGRLGATPQAVSEDVGMRKTNLIITYRGLEGAPEGLYVDPKGKFISISGEWVTDLFLYNPPQGVPEGHPGILKVSPILNGVYTMLQHRDVKALVYLGENPGGTELLELLKEQGYEVWAVSCPCHADWNQERAQECGVNFYVDPHMGRRLTE